LHWAIWAAAVQAWPTKGKLVKLAKACLPPGREPNSRSGAVTTVTLAIQVAAQIGSARVLLLPSMTQRYEKDGPGHHNADPEAARRLR